MLSTQEKEILLSDLIEEAKLSNETPWLEFKMNISDSGNRQGASISYDRVSEYISGLSNSACYHNKSKAYLVLGVRDKTWKVEGTNFSLSALPEKQKNFELSLALKIFPQISYQFDELVYEGKRVVIISIPAAVGMPTSSSKKRFIRIGSSLTSLDNYPEMERYIYASKQDLSAEIVKGASIEDLDERAIAKAKKLYAERNPDLNDEVQSWNTVEFLNRAKVTIKGEITRTALLLLGKAQSAHLLGGMPEICWRLKTADGETRDYWIGTVPFLLSVDEVFSKVRRLKYRYINPAEQTIFPEEIDTYDSYVIREALHNAIAHHDYHYQSRIELIEYDDRLIFCNAGRFLPRSIQEVLVSDAPESTYRNPFLVQAMRELKMVDTIGSGIQKMFRIQKKRCFPMPDYDIDNEKCTVKVTIMGKILDMAFSNILIQNSDISLRVIEMLNRVQFKKKLDGGEVQELKRMNLVEGRGSNIFISQRIAKEIGEEASYTKNKGLDDNYYMQLILEAIKQHQELSRKNINQLLWGKLPEILSDVQKENKITNLLSKLKKSGAIQVSKGKKWVSCD